jgi:hypothetical protein
VLHATQDPVWLRPAIKRVLSELDRVGQFEQAGDDARVDDSGAIRGRNVCQRQVEKAFHSRRDQQIGHALGGVGRNGNDAYVGFLGLRDFGQLLRGMCGFATTRPGLAGSYGEIGPPEWAWRADSGNR